MLRDCAETGLDLLDGRLRQFRSTFAVPAASVARWMLDRSYDQPVTAGQLLASGCLPVVQQETSGTAETYAEPLGKAGRGRAACVCDTSHILSCCDSTAAVLGAQLCEPSAGGDKGIDGEDKEESVRHRDRERA